MTRRKVTLTFDNGPTPGVTEHVLDELGRRGLKATFFIVARDLLVEGNRALAERAASEGHWHGNHTLTHSVQFGLVDDLALVQREVEAAQIILGDLGHEERYFRPWGNGRIDRALLSPAVVDALSIGGYSLALWNCVPRDWEDPVGWPEKALTMIEQQDWSVVVIHDQATGAMEQLPRFLDALEERGIEVTQELPDSCVPIRRGRHLQPLDDLMPLPSSSGA